MKSANKSYFVTGVDTGIGKTLTCAVLAHSFLRHCSSVGLLKPVESGVTTMEDGDVGFYRRVCPRAVIPDATYSFKAPLSPHVAARCEKRRIHIPNILRAMDALMAKTSLGLIEGVGGLMVPLRRGYVVLDLIRDCRLPVILVCPNRLGVLNHALLSLRAMEQAGVVCAGFIVNHLSPATSDLSQKTNIDELKKLLRRPFLGCIPYINTVDHPGSIRRVGQHLAWRRLI